MPLINEPVCLKIDPTTHELVVPLEFVAGVEAVNTGIKVRLLLFRGEWFLDESAGVPYWQDLLGRKFDERTARAAFRGEILTTPGVAEIRSLDVTFNAATRELSVAWEVRYEFTDTPAEGSLSL